MSELRRDPIVGYWTIISEERGWRPNEFRNNKILVERDCPFCEGKENQTTEEIYAIRKPSSLKNSPGWDVRSIKSKLPILSADDSPAESEAMGIYDTRPGAGQHEIIVETPKHKHDLDEFELSDLEKVIEAYVSRINSLESEKKYQYALLFKNHGLVSGAATDVVRHSRSQLIGMPIIPKRAKEELEMAKNYYERRDRCVFCDVLKQEMKDESRVIMQNEAFFAFCPFASRFPFEMWILPKKHSADFAKIEKSNFLALAKILKGSLVKLRNLLDDPSYNLILHTAPFRHQKKSGDWNTIEQDYHWYIQIMPRLTMAAGFEWGTGIHINPTPPERAAQLLRETSESITI